MLRDADLMQSPLGDGKLFDVLGRWYHADPPEELLWEAANLYEGASPAMVQGAARWLGVARDLAAAGLDGATIARVFLSSAMGEPPGWVPPGPVLGRILEGAGDGFDPAAVAAEMLGAETLPHAQESLLTLCAAQMVRRGMDLPESFDPHIVFAVPWQFLRSIVEHLPPARRDAVLVRLIGKPTNANAARVQLRNALPILDLATGDGARAAIRAAARHLEGQDAWAELLAEVDAGGGPPAEREGPTEECRHAVEYWLQQYAAKRRVESIGDRARAAHDRRLTLDAPELASFERWTAASESRRTAIALQLSAQVEGLSFSGFVDCDAGPIASFSHGELVFRLVPGGDYDRGFSADEEAVVRAAAEEARAADDNWFEEFGNFLENMLPWMRPVKRVSVGPLLACASPGLAMEPGNVSEYLDLGPWRLPSESEWEYLARGGRAHELLWTGNTVPDEAWFEETRAAGSERLNPFGCWGFGMEPEICADAWTQSYEGTPTDGSPHFGEGPRVTRGGAAQLYPWQQVGEWQLSCSACRANSSNWEFEVSVRPVLGIALNQ